MTRKGLFKTYYQGRNTCMAYQPLEELLPKASMSVYRLVRLASMRATELATTGIKLTPAPADQKLATTALDEIRGGFVHEKGSGPIIEGKKRK
jgi:DNA-directed RNA polymerase subunit K/omega